MRTPNPLLWLWYAWGGKIPDRYREWVLHDVTTRHWILRHGMRSIARLLTLAVPTLVIFMLVHAPLWIALIGIVLGMITGVYYSMSYVWENTDARLGRYGYPSGYAEEVRQSANADERAERQRRYVAAWRSGAEDQTGAVGR